MYRRYYKALLLLALLSPLGLIAEGTAWGEWGSDEIKDMLGYVPDGMNSFGEMWQALLPDYSMEFLQGNVFGQIAGYMVSAAVGSLLIYGVAILLTKLIVRQKNKEVYTDK